MSVTGALYTCRPDLVGFVNGLPLVVVELKKPGIPAKQAFDDNLTSYKHPQNGIPDLFWYNALLIASNGIESRVGTLTADWERFFEWKRDRAGGRTPACLAGGDAPRRLRPGRASSISWRTSRCSPRTVWPAQDSGPEPSGARRQQGHSGHAGGSCRRSRTRRRVLAHPGRGQEPVDGLLRAEDPAAHRRQLDVRDRDRPRGAGRPDRQDVQGHWRGERAGEPGLPRRERRGVP